MNGSICTVRDLRRAKQEKETSLKEHPLDVVMDMQEVPSATVTGQSSSPGRANREVAADWLQKDRFYYWERLSSLMKVQRWWRALLAKRRLSVGIEKRKLAARDVLRGESAEAIQRWWQLLKRARAHREAS